MKCFHYIAFTAGIALTGCLSTEGKLEIKGKVIDEGTHEPIAFRGIIIQGLVTNDIKSVPVDAGQFYTDSTGCFTHTLKKVKDAYNYNFYLVGDSDYAYTTKEISLFELQSNAKYLTFTMNKLVDFTIRIFRKSKVPACDTLYMSWKSNGIDGRSVYPYRVDNYDINSSLQLRWIGGNVRSAVITKALADKKTTVRWVLFRNGRSREIIDTITCRRDRLNEVKLIY
jgi:hypothetical protein